MDLPVSRLVTPPAVVALAGTRISLSDPSAEHDASHEPSSMAPALTSSALPFSPVTPVWPDAAGAGLQEMPVAGKAWLSRTRILTRNVLASTTPTLRSELPYASSLPEGEMLNVVTGFSDSCLVWVILRSGRDQEVKKL